MRRAVRELRKRKKEKYNHKSVAPTLRLYDNLHALVFRLEATTARPRSGG
jgi:hypothetical protein